MNNITIERSWADPVIDLYELQITCQNDQITVSATECWASNDIIDDLSTKIQQYSSKEILEFEWRIGNSEDNQQSSILIKVLPTDKFGYLFIKISIKACNPFDPDKYNECSMYIKTEIGLLETFGKRISKLKERENNIIVSLVN